MPRRVQDASLRPSRRRTYAIAAGAAAVLLAGGSATAVALSSSHAGHSTAATRLDAAACAGPAGAAYVADAGWDGFSAINTTNCDVIQTYNVGDTQVPGFSGDYNYDSTDEGIALSGSTLYFADTGNSTVGVIDTTTLDPSNYNPDEKLINVGLFPQDLAVSPDGSQVWVADTGAQTSPRSRSGISVISAASDTVVAKMRLRGEPSQIAFSPSGAQVYVTTSKGLWIYNTASRKRVKLIRGLGGPHGIAVSPDGATIYVTGSNSGTLAVISAATDRVTATIKVGQLPWQAVVSANGGTVYVANPDSDSISVINAATRKVSNTIIVTGDPDTLALTPNGQELWVGGQASANMSVIDVATNAITGSVNLGGDGPQSGDGFQPTGVVLTATPTPGSGADQPAAKARTSGSARH